MSLRRDIRRVERGFVEGIERSIGELAFSVLSTVVLATPVGDPGTWQSPPPQGYVGGRARGNWQVSIGDPITTELNTIDKSGQPTITKGRSTFARYKLGRKIFISNNVPYMQRLNDGHSPQARPAGFVQRAILAGIQNLDTQRDLFS